MTNPLFPGLPDDGHEPADAASWLPDILRWRLTAAEWEQVADLLSMLERATAGGDRTQVGAALGELIRVAPLEARRLGTDTQPGAQPVPPRIRERVNSLVHQLVPPSLDEDADVGQPVTDDGPNTAASTTAAQRPTVRAFFRLPVPYFAHDRSNSTGTRGGQDFRAAHELLVEGTRVLRRQTNHRTIEVFVIASPRARDYDVLELAVGTPETRVSFLLPLWSDLDGRLVSVVEVPSSATDLNDAITRPFPAEQLREDDIESVIRSIRGAGRSGRNAWRKIARARASTDPIRAAIVEALR